MNIIKAPIESVIPWDKNPRGIKTKDYDRLKKQITKLGVYKPLIAFKEDGKYIVLGGNMRIRALKEMGLKEVDISVVDPKTEAQKIEFALSDNDRAGFYEEDKLAELVYPHIKDIDLGDFKVDLGEALDLKQVVERYGPDIDDGADEVPEIDDTPAITKMGDLFTLGKHRLLCGDSTKAEDVARLMRGEKANTILTDPPYGMGKAIAGDSDTPQEMIAFGNKWVALCEKNGTDDCVLFSFHGTRLFWTLLESAKTTGFLFQRMMWLSKPNDITFPWHTWILKSEAILAFHKGKPKYPDIHPYAHDTYEWNHGKFEVTAGVASRKTPHPTIKPRPVVEDILKRLPEGNVLDPFLGSGTTLIAAEKLNRVCYGMEIDPKYCDVIIKRYADYVGVEEKAIRKTVEHGK